MQNGVAERWVDSCRRSLLDHIIAVNEQDLKRLLSEYIGDYLDDRTHFGRDNAEPPTTLAEKIAFTNGFYLRK